MEEFFRGIFEFLMIAMEAWKIDGNILITMS